MVSDDGDSVLVFNGEIYNHAELRRELEALGHRFVSRCDTEVVLRAFLEWDVRSFAKLRGMFGAALWSESRRRLLLVRDRVGIKPLYYRRHGDSLYFGSEMKAILLHPELDRRMNLRALERYLSCNYVPGTETLVEDIQKLAPGNWLEWQDGALSMHPYWRLEFKPDVGLDLADGKRGTRPAAAIGGHGAFDFGRAARRVVQRGPGFLDHPALRGGSVARAAEDIFGFLPRA